MIYLLIEEMYGPSEFIVLAAFTTRELAQAAQEVYNDTDYGQLRIDEVPIDPEDIPWDRWG